MASRAGQYAALAAVAALGVWLIVVPQYHDWLIITGAMLVWVSLKVRVR